MENVSKVIVLYLKYVRDPLAIFDSQEALQAGIDELKRNFPYMTDKSFITKEFVLNQLDI